MRGRCLAAMESVRAILNWNSVSTLVHDLCRFATPLLIKSRCLIANCEHVMKFDVYLKTRRAEVREREDMILINAQGKTNMVR